MQNYFGQLIDGKMITGEDVQIATKVFFGSKTEMKALDNIKAGTKGSCEVKIEFPANFQDYYESLIPKINNLITDDDLKKRWQLPHSEFTVLLIIDNNDITKNIVIKPKIKANVRVKKNVNAGDGVGLDDFYDVKEVLFEESQIDQNAINANSQMYFIGNLNGIIYVFADFNADKNLTLNSNKEHIAKVFRYLCFHNIYNTKTPDDWFPFVEILSDINQNNNIDNFENFVISCMSKDRIDNMIAKWNQREIFNNRIEIIKEGVLAYFSNQYCNCISNLITQIEGIMRDYYPGNKANGVKTDKLRQQVNNNAKNISKEDTTHLFFYEDFKSFFDNYFKNFNETDNNHDLSRNTIAHGKLQYEQYTQAEALKLLLILDQLYYYTSK